jgi:hypothetical protein
MWALQAQQALRPTQPASLLEPTPALREPKPPPAFQPQWKAPEKPAKLALQQQPQAQALTPLTLELEPALALELPQGIGSKKLA